MIWESVPLMTLFDLGFIFAAVTAAATLIWIRRKSRLQDLAWGPLMIVFGLGIIGLFYSADLFVMYGLPLLVSPERAMAAMAAMHLNYSWLVNLLAVALVLVGVVVTSRSMVEIMADLRDSGDYPLDAR